MDLSALETALAATPVNEYRYFPSIGSTNDEALRWVDAGAADFSLVIADEQTSGRGRFDRRWVTNPGAALAFSLILQPAPAELASLALFAPLCGLALRDTLHSYYALHPQIKWPNDVLLAGKKTAGILVEASWSDQVASGIVLGIGVNITPAALPHLGAQLFPATCLEEHLAPPLDRVNLLARLLNSLAAWRPQLGTPRFFAEWERHLAFKGQSVRIEDLQKTSIIGVVKGVNHQGNLVLTLADGRQQDFTAGDVHLRPLDPQ
jgi:BirA family biotin operon repressor/biotin-[acetyl-CoA-carboxylase] ligase